MAHNLKHLLTHAVFAMKPFLRPFRAYGVLGPVTQGWPPWATILRPYGAYGVVVPTDPGLNALGYYPTPLRGLLILACALSFPPVPAAAQSVTGAFVGRITDPSDSVIVGAQVQAINAATGAVDAANTDETGSYRIANLLPGEYFLEVEAPGFQTAKTSAQRLSLADNLRQNIELQLGAETDSVTIEDTAGEVNSEDAQLGKVMRDIGVLPVLSTAEGRSVLALAYTQPGTVPAGDKLGGITINGQRARQNHFAVQRPTNGRSACNGLLDTPQPTFFPECNLHKRWPLHNIPYDTRSGKMRPRPAHRSHDTTAWVVEQ